MSRGHSINSNGINPLARPDCVVRTLSPAQLATARINLAALKEARPISTDFLALQVWISQRDDLQYQIEVSESRLGTWVGVS